MTAASLLGCQLIMRGISHSSSGSSLPTSTSRKRKWNSSNVTRIDFGDDDDDDISTAVVHQATRDRRRVERTFHQIPMPFDPPTTPEPYAYVVADNMDAETDAADDNNPGKVDDEEPWVRSSSVSRALVETRNATG